MDTFVHQGSKFLHSLSTPVRQRRHTKRSQEEKDVVVLRFNARIEALILL